MLKTRVTTAIVMLAVFLCALFWLPAPAWAAFAGLMLLPAAWEWARLTRLPTAAHIPYALAIVALCAALMLLPGGSAGPGREISLLIYAVASAFWLCAVPLWLWRAWQPARYWLALSGAVVLIPTWMALVQLRDQGMLLLLLVMAVVWISDSAAYFSGRRFGRRKLAPSISPGKTWEGVAGALLAVGLYGVVWIGAGQAYFPKTLGASRAPAAWMLVLLWLLAAAGIYGDLFESALKRRAGVKDSGTILPGHGGMLDRIDALIAALPLAALAYIV